MEATEEIPIFDTLRLEQHPYIRQLLQMNDEQLAAHNEKKAKGKLGGLFGKKTIVQDTQAEKVHLSCKIVKINKYGINQTRIILITQKNIYNLTDTESKYILHS